MSLMLKDYQVLYLIVISFLVCFFYKENAISKTGSYVYEITYIIFHRIQAKSFFNVYLFLEQEGERRGISSVDVLGKVV
jgi:hypothetical protein